MSYRGPKVKLSRRLGISLTRKAVLVMIHKKGGPGQHGMRRRRNSDYGLQLLEKQRLKFQYNVSEKQLRRYFKEANASKGNTGDNLIRLLESRLDCQVYRSGFAPTIYAARQLVSHGHIKVNGKKIDIPSYRIKPSDTISIKEKSRKIPIINEALENANQPPYVETDAANFSAKYVREPEMEEVPITCEIGKVIEYCSR